MTLACGKKEKLVTILAPRHFTDCGILASVLFAFLYGFFPRWLPWHNSGYASDDIKVVGT